MPINTFEDKENVAPGLQGSFRPLKSVAAPSQPSKGSRFSRMLDEVTNEIRIEGDEQVAMQHQVDEAFQVASQWVQEEQDRRVAETVEKRIVEEEREQRSRDAAKGESAALALAMEERRRVVHEAQAKKDRESKDAEMCRKIVLDDVEEDHHFRELCAKDEDVAKEVYNSLQDELYAEELQRREDEAYRLRMEEKESLIRADAKIAEDFHCNIQRELDIRQAKQMESDYAMAKDAQDELSRQVEIERRRQEAHDAKYSRKLAISAAREEHRRKKRIEWISSNDYKPFSDVETIAKQWMEADAEVEDVEDGICLTLVLPHLRDLKVKVRGKKTVEIDAYRMIYVGDNGANADNSQYIAEFVIEGPKVSIASEDLSYEYSSETGLLHIYVEKVHLQDDSRGAVDASSEGRQGFLKGIKDTFRRMLGRE